MATTVTPTHAESFSRIAEAHEISPPAVDDLLEHIPVGLMVVDANGKVALYNGSGAGTDLLADVAGYYLAGASAEPGTFVSVGPARVLDTRSGIGAAVGRVAAQHRAAHRRLHDRALLAQRGDHAVDVRGQVEPERVERRRVGELAHG